MAEILTDSRRASWRPTTAPSWPPSTTAAGPTPRDPDDLEEYRAAMVAERRLVYVLTPERVYPSPR